MGYKSGQPAGPTQEIPWYGQSQDWFCKLRLWLHHIHVRMSPRVPQHSCSPFSRAWVSKWPNGMVGEQDYTPCSVLRAARMSSCLGSSQSFSIPAHCKISFWEDCFSFISLGPIHASPINPAKFKSVLKTVSIKWLFNQFDQKCSCQKCGTPV